MKKYCHANETTTHFLETFLAIYQKPNKVHNFWFSPFWIVMTISVRVVSENQKPRNPSWYFNQNEIQGIKDLQNCWDDWENKGERNCCLFQKTRNWGVTENCYRWSHSLQESGWVSAHCRHKNSNDFCSLPSKFYSSVSCWQNLCGNLLSGILENIVPRCLAL